MLVRDLRGKVAIGTPEVLRARNAREFRALDTDPDAVPVAARAFSRAERLLVRFPAYAPDGQHPVVARLLNRMGQPMRTLDLRPAPTATTKSILRCQDWRAATTSSSSPRPRRRETSGSIGFRVTSCKAQGSDHHAYIPRSRVTVATRLMPTM